LQQWNDLSLIINMPIRNATYHDAPAIKILLEALGYKASFSLLVDQLETQFGKDGHQVYVYELRKEVVGFVAVHYLPQLAFTGGVALITYLSVDEIISDTAIAGALEQYVTEQARLKKCEKIQVHCLDWRVPGYTECPSYFTKLLVDEK
jgi:N-acetylglutamate synthase-like GNAT family acetyltransferase